MQSNAKPEIRLMRYANSRAIAGVVKARENNRKSRSGHNSPHEPGAHDLIALPAAASALGGLVRRNNKTRLRAHLNTQFVVRLARLARD